MKTISIVKAGLIMALLFSLVSTVSAANAIVEKEMVPSYVVTEKFVKTADNFVIMFDSSSSMKVPYKETGMTTLEVAKEFLRNRNGILPDLGFNSGLYTYTPFKTYYELGPYDRKKFGQAIDELPSKASGATLLQQGMMSLEKVLKNTTGRTVIFLFTDGNYSQMTGSLKPIDFAKRITKNYNVCFYIISTAAEKTNKEILKKVASISPCSRVVAFDDMYEKPVYLAGALFVIKREVQEVFITVEKVVSIEEGVTVETGVGYEADSILFDYDREDIRSDYIDDINVLGHFLENNPRIYAVLSGFADSTGNAEYNLGLSRRRAEFAQNYILKNFNVTEKRVVTEWYGELNPIADNTTAEGREKNRRIEVVLLPLE